MLPATRCDLARFTNLPHSQVLRQWAAYNEDPGQTSRPPLNDADGNPLVFNANGSVADAATLASIKQPAGPSSGCNQFNIGGPQGSVTDPTCSSMLPAFLRSYDVGMPVTTGDGSQLTAVEKYRDNVVQGFIMLYTSLRPSGMTDAQYLAFFQKNFDVPSTCMDISAPQGYSGLRVFDRDNNYFTKETGMPQKISKPGSVVELVNFIGHGAPSVVDTLTQRIKQIKPEASDAEIKTLLDKVKLELESVHYVYMVKPDSARQLLFTTTPPKNSVAGSRPDGAPTTYSTGKYQTIRRAVDPQLAGSGTPFNTPPVLLKSPWPATWPSGHRARVTRTIWAILNSDKTAWVVAPSASPTD